MPALLEEGRDNGLRDLAARREGLSPTVSGSVWMMTHWANFNALSDENQHGPLLFALRNRTVQSLVLIPTRLKRSAPVSSVCIRSSAKDPNDIARKKMDELLYGDTLRLASQRDEGHRDPLTRDDLIAAH